MTTFTSARRAVTATAAAAAASCLILGLSCSSASATQVPEPIPQHSRTTHANVQHGHAGTGTAGTASTGTAGAVKPAGARQVSAALDKTSRGFHLYNQSSYNLVLQSADGDNVGVPGDGSALNSAVGYHDFEVVFRAAATTSVSAVYQMLDINGQRVGTAYFHMNVNALDSTSFSSDFRDMSNNKMPLKAVSFSDASTVGDSYKIVNSNTTTSTVDISDPQASGLIKQFCEDDNNYALCTFTPTQSTATTESKLLTSGYMDSQSEGESDVEVEGGYTQTTSTSTDLVLSASLKIAHIITIGVKTAYKQDIETSHSFDYAFKETLRPGTTSYVWGQVPVTKYTGTLSTTIGNTTWKITNYSTTTPDQTRTITSLSGATIDGYFPIGKPDARP